MARKKARATTVGALDQRRVEIFRKYRDALPEKHRTVALPYKGEKTEFDVLRVPLDEVHFNVETGRLIVDRLTVLKVPDNVDPDDPAVQKQFEKRIFELDETNKLLDQIRKVGQLEPGVTTADGTVINGNRRLAVLRHLYQETKDPKYSHIEVALLPEDATRKELFLLEAFLQMTPESREKYGPVTTALEIERGINEFRVPKDVVARTMNLKSADVDDFLERLEFMKEYLAFIGKEGEYRLLEGEEGQGKNEHFIEVQKLYKRYGTEPFWQAFLHQVFLLIRKGTSYIELRKIKGWRLDELQTFAEVLGGGFGKGVPTASGKGAFGKLSKEFSRLGAGRRLARLRIPKPAATSAAQDKAEMALKRAVEQHENLEQGGSPEKLLEQAIRKVKAVDLSRAQQHAKNEKRTLPKQRLVTLIDELKRQADALRREVARFKSA